MDQLRSRKDALKVDKWLCAVIGEPDFSYSMKSETPSETDFKARQGIKCILIQINDSNRDDIEQFIFEGGSVT